MDERRQRIGVVDIGADVGVENDRHGSSALPCLRTETREHRTDDETDVATSLRAHAVRRYLRYW